MTAPTPSPETAEAISDAELRKIEQDARAAAECWAVPPRAGIWGNGTVQSLVARLRRAEAEIADLKAERAWRPIETARNAGHRRFLCWNSRYGIRIGTVVDRADHDDWLSYMDAWGGSSKGGVRATHWLPLPAPPAEETDNG